tara:strand:- start:57886 stop:58614 length:729 start_codon:yes stop_codon:yes gene_type:complete
MKNRGLAPKPKSRGLALSVLSLAVAALVLAVRATPRNGSTKIVSSQPKRDSRSHALSVLSLAVAALALAVAASSFFNGSVRQERFETTKQYCIEKTVDYGAFLNRVELALDTEADLRPVLSEENSVTDAVRTACFRSGLLDIRRVLRLLAIQSATSSLLIGAGESGLTEAAQRLVDGNWSLNNDIYEAALNADPPSIFPWVPTEPIVVFPRDWFAPVPGLEPELPSPKPGVLPVTQHRTVRR